MRRFALCILLLGATLFATVAIGQVGVEPLSAPVTIEVPPAGTTDQVIAWVTAGVGLFVIICNALATIFPSTNKLMRVVDAFAFNWKKARSDPDLQKWGS